MKIRKEVERCYELINRLGRGAVYLGSSRMGPDHPHYLQAFELGREASPSCHLGFYMHKQYILFIIRGESISKEHNKLHLDSEILLHRIH